MEAVSKLEWHSKTTILHQSYVNFFIVFARWQCYIWPYLTIANNPTILSLIQMLILITNKNHL